MFGLGGGLLFVRIKTSFPQKKARRKSNGQCLKISFGINCSDLVFIGMDKKQALPVA